MDGKKCVLCHKYMGNSNSTYSKLELPAHKKCIKQESKEHEISYCCGCYCMTKSKRVSRAKYKCNKCGHNKFLSDFLMENKNE